MALWRTRPDDFLLGSTSPPLFDGNINIMLMMTLGCELYEDDDVLLKVMSEVKKNIKYFPIR